MMAGFAAVVDDPLLAAVAATATLTVCGDGRPPARRGPGRSPSRCWTSWPPLTPADLAANGVRLS